MTPQERTGNRLDRLYRARFDYVEREAKSAVWRVLCSEFFAKFSSSEATVLDVGAGYCDFINNIPGRRKIAVDLNPDVREFAAPGVEIHVVPLDQLGDAAEPGTVDLVFASNVFEHLRGPDALIETLSTIRELLKPGGQVVIMQPNIRRVKEAFWDFVDHTLPLTEKGMAEALRSVGLEVVECRASFMPYTTKSRVPKWPGLVRLYLAFRPAQWLFGKQMLLVARREA